MATASPAPPPRSMAFRFRFSSSTKLLAVLASFLCLASMASGLVFHVGGPRGWRVPDANTSYSWWAMNNRFHVGDALYFKYENDSVLEVDREAFNGCDLAEPVRKFDDGNTTVRLDRPGFFCFISGEDGHCDEGQRLVVRVMVHRPAAAPGPGPSPAKQPSGGGGGSGVGSGAPPGPSGWPWASSRANAVAAGVSAVAAGLLVLVSLLVV